MTTTEQQTAGHDHGVRLDDTFDFLNTLDTDDGFVVDKLETPDGAVRWFAERGLVHAESIEASGATLNRIRSVRAALREVTDAVVDGRTPRVNALDTINDAMRARAATELVVGPDGVGVGHRHVGDPVDDALARISEPLVTELSAGHPERIRICASDTCAWIFYDESRAGRRRWCDMATCGNRAKAARHRARQRSAGDSGSAAANQGSAAAN
jgi:predicted RNA-binding Zn ribbon-like protein